jgi:hypothetical protein
VLCRAAEQLGAAVESDDGVVYTLIGGQIATTASSKA